MGPAVARAIASETPTEARHTSAHDSVIEALTSHPLDRDADRYFLEDEIMPRIVMCETSALMNSVAGIERDRFIERAQDVQNRPGRASLRHDFIRDCGQSASEADWVWSLANFVSIIR
ncbi:BZ3500_MvSof-1268-A1-R1_Chr9g10868 [Microbotryum saponariae]|uniref:BZ3500_MvSof-1268-A1-R1_Chr9g10868 protein n=1 Tax=Microbotryum saponariae TaxID=289078 RepID=A0A2X0LNW9_9BASI|nr:BZ3501_MvSof-1269-A2-R1_Chr9g10616 [Microbotryum saponariae]SDA00833.1 BZ3500_MvSof-1268-A1-R1_Chr9g10868 [Microbotryum saponariae]